MTPAAVKAAAAGAILAAAALLWSAFPPPRAASHPEPVAPAVAAAGGAPAVARAQAPFAIGAPAHNPPALLAPAVPPPPAVPLGSNEVPDLQADAQGRLVVDVHTRNELEKLIALNDRAAAQALLQRLEAVLLPAAYRQAVDAFYGYQNYGIAAAQLTSPTQPVTDETSALQQLEALHALRVQQFGPEVAQAYFGDEEATARRLIAEMREQPTVNSTLAERAEQVQRMPTPAR